MAQRLNYSTYLFVPATRLERVSKAFEAGADAVIVDLEDAVAASHKDEARQNLCQFLQNNSDNLAGPIFVRINSQDQSPVDYDADLQALSANNQTVSGIFLPKVESAQAVSALHSAVSVPIIAMIESAVGLLNIAQIAKASGLRAFTYGCLDFANDVGVDSASPAAQSLFERVRLDLLLHSKVNQLLAPIETIYPNFKDDEGLKNYAQHWSDLGFGGMLCIHPLQVSIINAVRQPSAQQLEFAHKVVEEYRRTGLAAFQLDGQMVDLPVIEKAQKLLRIYLHSNDMK